MSYFADGHQVSLPELLLRGVGGFHMRALLAQNRMFDEVISISGMWNTALLPATHILAQLMYPLCTNQMFLFSNILTSYCMLDIQIGL